VSCECNTAVIFLNHKGHEGTRRRTEVLFFLRDPEPALSGVEACPSWSKIIQDTTIDRSRRATINSMAPRIAIPVPHSEREYAERSLPPYERAVQMAGGEPVPISLDQAPAEVMKLIAGCDAVLLPGSTADFKP
jgi:hypothetical protein